MRRKTENLPISSLKSFLASFITAGEAVFSSNSRALLLAGVVNALIAGGVRLVGA